MNAIRVRQLISQLHYPDLVASQVVPDLEPFTPTFPNKRYPPWLYALSKTNSEIFCDFGLFIEEIIYTAISSPHTPLNYPQIWSHVCCSSPPDDLTSATNYFGGIINTFKPMFVGHSVQHEPTLAHDNIQGHPDFFCDNFEVGHSTQTWIIDVKTTTGFRKMAHQTYLQILSYSALARAMGYINNYIGVLFPVQRQIIWYDVTNWNSSQYLALLMREGQWVAGDHAVYTGFRFTSMQCGGHVNKNQLVEHALESEGRPLQVFLSNPRGKSITSDTEVAHFLQEIPLNTTVFVHAPYIINLCNREADMWAVNHLRNELRIASTLNFKGVVVHVGKAKDTPTAQALDAMEQSIREVLSEATSDCPLIIETPAGQGTELCVPCEELMAFYRRFDGADNLKICVDSCHVFASGYDPCWYLQEWLTQLPGSVILVHFNDSEVPRGARADRHAIPGLGFIGYERMRKFHDLCVENNIPMVRE